MNATSIGKTGKTLNEGKCLFFQHDKRSLMLGNVVLGNDRIPGNRHTTAPATKNFLDAGSQVSARLQLSQLSALPMRHSSLIRPFAKMGTVKRMVLLQWSLLDPCMRALSSVVVIDVNWIAARMSYQWARLARH